MSRTTPTADKEEMAVGKYILIGSRGGGSVIVEQALLKVGAELELGHTLLQTRSRDSLLELNPSDKFRRS